MNPLMLELFILRIAVVLIILFLLIRWTMQLFFAKSDCYACTKRAHC